MNAFTLGETAGDEPVGGILSSRPLTQVTLEDQVPRKNAYALAHPEVVFHPPRRGDPMWTAVLDGGDVEVRAIDLGLLMNELEALDSLR